MNDKIRILVAEDHLVARVGVTTIVNMQPDMTVVAEAANGQQAVEMFRKHQPDVTLLDLRMPGMGGVEAAIAIRSESPSAQDDRAHHLRRRRRYPPRSGGRRAGIPDEGRAARRTAQGDPRRAMRGRRICRRRSRRRWRRRCRVPT